MDWHIALSVVAGIISFCSIIPYIRDILHGTTRPNAITWLLWLFIQTIAIAAQFYEGASWSVIFVIIDGITIAIVLAFSLAGYGYHAWNAFDVWCGFFGIVAIVAWQFTGNGVLALVFSVVADGLAALPTLRKALQDPWSENPTGWAFTTTAAVLAVVSNTRFDAANLLFPGYLIVVNGLTFAFAFFGRKARLRPQKS